MPLVTRLLPVPKISYSFYLLHLVVMYALAQAFVGLVFLPKFGGIVPTLLLTICTFGFTTSLAWFSHTAVERPYPAWKDIRIGKRRQGVRLFGYWRALMDRQLGAPVLPLGWRHRSSTAESADGRNVRFGSKAVIRPRASPMSALRQKRTFAALRRRPPLRVPSQLPLGDGAARKSTSFCIPGPIRPTNTPIFL